MANATSKTTGVQLGDGRPFHRKRCWVPKRRWACWTTSAGGTVRMIMAPTDGRPNESDMHEVWQMRSAPEPRPGPTHGMAHLELVTITVEDYDQAIGFFTDVLDFELTEDSPSLTNDGRPKRWVVVTPRGGAGGVLLAKADGERQTSAVGRQAAGRVGFFLRVDDFDSAHARLVDADVEIVSPPRSEPYGRVAVFVDIAGNKWDLLGD